MGERGIVGELPNDMLESVLMRDPSWVVDFLRHCTLFDSDMIGMLLRIGIQSCRAELERRTAGNPIDPPNEAASDRVIEIPIGAGKTAVLGGNDDDETAIVVLRNSSTENAIGAPVTGEDASPLIQSGDVVLRILNPQGAQVVIDAIQWAQKALLQKELDAWDPPTPEVVEQPTEATPEVVDEPTEAAADGVAPPHPAPDDSLEMLF